MSHYSDKHYFASDDYDRFYYGILFKKGSKILDIGCSTGNFAAQDHKNIVGVDIDADAIKIAKKRGLNAFQHDITKKLPFNSNSIDNVHCRHVLEHMKGPLFLMKDIFRILKKNGRLVLMTDRMTDRFWDDYTHQKPFTKKSLEQLAYDAGFRKCRVYEFPSRGVFGVGFLYKHKLLSPASAKRIYELFGRLFRTDGILLDAIK